MCEKARSAMDEPGSEPDEPHGEQSRPTIALGTEVVEAQGDPVIDLLNEWDEYRRRGEEPPPDWTRAIDPGLQEELDRRIRRRTRLHALLDLADPAPSRADGPDAPLPSFPGHETLGKIGHGGMGAVYKARDTELQRIVAIKTIAEGRFATPGQRERFRDEARAVARLRHPNIIAIHAIGEHEDQPYLTLEFAEGGSLAQRLVEKPMAPREAAVLLETLARAVHAAHQAGVVHRDLKPSNILLTADGVPKVSDFGLAKLMDADSGRTVTGQVSRPRAARRTWAPRPTSTRWDRSSTRPSRAVRRSWANRSSRRSSWSSPTTSCPPAGCGPTSRATSKPSA
jgi:tRNA A-37 threonylcarbamoyl transferase component Bud32